MKIVIANDHRAVKLKNKIVKYLKSKEYIVEDIGTDTSELVDFPDYAFKLGEKVSSGEFNYGICANIHNPLEAKMTREHNNANVMALSANMNFIKVKKIIDTFLKTPFSSVERYHIRLKKIKEYEEENNA